MGATSIEAYTFTVDIHTQTSYPTDPQVTLPTGPADVSVINESTATIVYVSFDGVTDQGRINPAVIAGATWTVPAHKIWLRVANDPGTAVDVTVMSQ